MVVVEPGIWQLLCWEPGLDVLVREDGVQLTEWNKFKPIYLFKIIRFFLAGISSL